MLRPVVSSDTLINQPQTLINCLLREEGFPPTKLNNLTHLHSTEQYCEWFNLLSRLFGRGNNERSVTLRNHVDGFEMEPGIKLPNFLVNFSFSPYFYTDVLT